jgi:2,3-bisphosphoglycerate-dependent phosphoglycerate mutase
MNVPNEPAEYRQHRFSPPPGSTEILLVRHGESAPARPGERFALTGGHGDPPLAPEGRWQADQLGVRLSNEDIRAIYVTTLRRTHETAGPLATRLGLEPIVEPDLREVYLGEWEGGRYRQMAAERDPRFMEAMQREEWGLIPGAETTDQLHRRVVGAVERIASEHHDQRILVVSHGGVIGALLSHAARARPFAFLGADNASVSHLVVVGERWIVRRFNDTGHLAGELSPAAQPPT